MRLDGSLSQISTRDNFVAARFHIVIFLFFVILLIQPSHTQDFHDPAVPPWDFDLPVYEDYDSDFDGSYDIVSTTTIDSPSVRPSQTPLVENGHWRNQIRCIGPMSYDLPLATILGPSWQLIYRDRYPTVRKLCAKTVYGGNRVWNAGGYCLRLRPRLVVFERLDQSVLDAEQLQIMMFCKLRCRCLSNISPLEPDERVMPAREVLDAERLHPIVYDKNPAGNPNIERLLRSDPRSGHAEVSVTVMLLPEVSDENIRRQAMLPMPVPPPPDMTHPVCVVDHEGWIPRPHPFNGDEWPRRLESICNAEWFGGSREGNLGMVCMQRRGIPYLRFLDYLSHPAYLPTNIPLGLAYHAFCRSACSCVIGARIHSRQVGMPYWTTERVVAIMPDDDEFRAGQPRQIVLQVGRDGEYFGSSRFVLLTEDNRRVRSICGLFLGEDGCTRRWPRQISLPGR